MPLSGGTFTGDVTWDNQTNAGQDIRWDESSSSLELDDNVALWFGDSRDFSISHTSNANHITVQQGPIWISAGAGIDINTGAYDIKTTSPVVLEAYTSGIGGRLSLRCGIGSGTGFDREVQLEGPATMAATYRMILPQAAPTSNDQVLSATTAGVCSWATPLSLANDANNRVITGTGSGLNGEANLTFDGSKLILGNSGTGNGSSAVQSFIAHGSTAGESGFRSIDTTSVAAGVGGEVSFAGKYNTGAQDYAYTGHIRGIKENATAGDTACALTFHTRPTATAPQERVRIDSNGKVGIGTTAPAQLLTVKGLSKFEATNSTNGWVNYTHTDNTYRLNYNGAGNDEIVIYSDGHVTKPNQPRFCAQKNGVGSTSTSANATQVFQTENFDIGGHYNNSTGVFTAPVTGTYYFYVQVLGGNNDARVMLYFNKNDSSNILEISGTTDNYNAVKGSLLISLAANDTMRVRNENSTVDLYSDADYQNQFMGWLVA